MKTLFGKVNVEINTDDIMYLNDLMRRDTAIPVKERYPNPTNDYEKNKYSCPKCDAFIVDNTEDKFCRICGQRIDVKNIEL